MHERARGAGRPASGARAAPRAVEAALAGEDGGHRGDCRRGGAAWPAISAASVSGDIYASAEYRAAVAPVYVKRALVEAARRAEPGLR